MIYKFGDKHINTKHVHAIGEPQYGHLFDPFVLLFFVGGKVECYFKEHEGDRIWEKEKGHALVLLNGKHEFTQSNGTTNYPHFTESIIYQRMTAEIEKLKDIINNNG